MTSPCAPSGGRTIRVLVQQAALPKYRVPVFRALAQRPGIDLRLVYGQEPNLPNAAPDGFNAQFLPAWQRRPLGQPLMWERAMWHYARRGRADVLMLEWNVHYASLIPALLRAKLNGVPTLVWGHGYSKRENILRQWARSNVARLATGLVFYNHTTARQFLAEGWDPQRIFVAINSLDQTPIQAARRHWLDQPEKLAGFRREKGLGDGPAILFVSRLEADNRVDLLLRAGRDLLAERPGLKLLIVGKGPDEPRLRELATTLGMDESVRFAGAIYDEMQLAPWFLSANVFCYPANIGLSILHAFGYALPVVTSDRLEAQNPEIEALGHERNGLLYKDGDIPSLAAALRRLLDDPALTSRLSRGAAQTVQEQFSLGKMVDGLVAAIEYAAGPGAPR